MSQSDNRLHLRYGVTRNIRTKHRQGAFHMPPLYGISSQQVVAGAYPHSTEVDKEPKKGSPVKEVGIGISPVTTSPAAE